jgi:hypothetical protein
MNDPVLRLDQAEVREVMAAWEHHADAGARADRAGEASKWKAAEEYAKAQEAGASLRLCCSSCWVDRWDRKR